MSVDDFGIGFTGLSQLRTLAVPRSRSTARSSPTWPTTSRTGPSSRSVIELATGWVPGDRRGRRDPRRGRLADRRRLRPRARATCGPARARGRDVADGATRRRSPATDPGRDRRRRGHRYDATATWRPRGAGLAAGDCPGPDRRPAAATPPARPTRSRARPAQAQFDQSLHDLLPAAVKERGTLQVGTDASYAPMSSFGPDGRTIVGMEPDLGAALGTVLGVRVRFVNTDFTRADPGRGRRATSTWPCRR